MFLNIRVNYYEKLKNGYEKKKEWVHRFKRKDANPINRIKAAYFNEFYKEVWKKNTISRVTTQVDFWQDLQDRQDLGKAGVGPQQRMQPGYEVSKAGTKGLPPNRRVRASMAPTAFFRAVEM